MSLINKDLPSGCLAGGIPVKILRENVYPRVISEEEKIRIVDQVIKEVKHFNIKSDRNDSGTFITLGKTSFDLPNRRIEGPANKETDKIKDILRRHGIRFRYYNDGEQYRPWD